MTDITYSDAVWVSTSKSADYVTATEHEGAVKFTRTDLIPAMLAEARAKGIREAVQHFEKDEYDVPNTMYSLDSIQREILTLLDQPAMRCAECDCEHGGEDCNWIITKPAETEGVTVQEAGMAIDPRVKDALDRLPHGEWEVWTSCSFRRISRVRGGDGDVLRGITQSSDGHPDLSWDENQCQAMCDLVNTLRALSGDRHE